MMSNSRYMCLLLFFSPQPYYSLTSTEGKYQCFHSFSYNTEKNNAYINEIKVSTPREGKY